MPRVPGLFGEDARASSDAATPALRRRRLALIGAALLGSARPSRGRAQAGFPDRPVRVLVPFAPGGGVDIVARLLAEPMRATLSQPVVVENRGGAGGQLGAQAVAKGAADGYTVLLVSAGEIAVAPSLYGKALPYDPARDLAPITLVVRVPNLLVVSSSVPARSAAELVDPAKRRPPPDAAASEAARIID